MSKFEFGSVLTQLGNVAKQLAPLVPGGGPVVMLAETIVNAIGGAAALHNGPTPPEVRESKLDLMKAVHAHAESTFNRAERGDG